MDVLVKELKETSVVRPITHPPNPQYGLCGSQTELGERLWTVMNLNQVMIPIAAAAPELVPSPEQVSTAPGIWQVAVTWLSLRDSTQGPAEQFPF